MLKDVYPLYLNNKAVQPNTDLEVTDKYTGEVAFRTALATPDVIEEAIAGAVRAAEPMARLGADVVGADAAPRNIPVAQLHAEQSGLTIDYRNCTAESLVEAGEQFDVVLNMEVVEHVADPLAYLTACQTLLKPGGLMVCSTLNRNPKSYLMAIIGAEHVMRWLPKGTHDWKKFITPDELYGLIRQAGLDPVDKKGMVFNPVSWRWAVSDRDLSVNYVTASIKR